MPNRFMKMDNMTLVGVKPKEKEEATNPLLKYGFDNGKPRFTIFKNDGEHYANFKDSIINVSIDMNSFMIMCDAIKSLISKGVTNELVMPIMVNAEDENGRFIKGEMVKHGVLLSGISKKGGAYIDYESKVGTRYRFPFLPPRRMGFYTDGVELSPEWKSIKYAESWFKMILEITAQAQIIKATDFNAKNRTSY